MGKIGKCVTCGEYWRELTDGQCDKCREKYVERCKEIAERRKCEKS